MTVSAATSAPSTAAVSSPGIGSGLDVTGIVQKLMTVEQLPLTALQSRASSYHADLSAFSSVQGALSSLQSATQALTNPSQFQSVGASVADSSIFTASTGTASLPGSYSVEVKTLAQSQKLISGGFANTTDPVGTGTLTIRFGTYNSVGNTFTVDPNKAAGSVTIAAVNNTLAGVRDAINAASMGVTATIVNDGSSNGNRIVITSNSTGAASSLRVQASDGDGSNTDAAGLSQLAYDPTATAGSGKNMSQTVAAQDATLNIDGIAVSKPTNLITDAIQGVTLNLAKAQPGVPTTLTLSSNSAGLQNALGSFVSAYNTLNSTMAQLTTYDAASKSGGQLLGDPTAQAIQVRVRAALSQAVQSGTLSSVTQLGVAFQKNGSLSLDISKLNAVVASHPNDIAGLFAAVGTPSDSLITFSAAGTATRPGAYTVNISQVATHGAAQGTAVAPTVITAGVNDSLSFAVDGSTASVTLAPGTYTAAALAQQLQTQINGLPALSSSSVAVTVTQSGGVLNIASQSYGAGSSVSLTGGNGVAALFGTSTSASGVDVAGTINGVPATGTGQALTGARGSAAEGLKLQVNGGVTGARGSVSFSRGIADQLNTLLTGYVGAGGIIQSRANSLNSQIQQNTQQQTVLHARLAQVQANYLAQFTSLDTLLTSMNSTSSFLTQQFASMAAITDNIASSKR